MTLQLRIPPPIVAVATGVAMWAIARLTPSLTISIPASRIVAGVILLIGLCVSISGMLAFRRAQTTVNPMNPSAATALVDFGIYRRTRNPMYLGLLCLLIAWTIWLSNPLALLGPICFVMYMNRFQIGPEEMALSTLFGERYAEFRSRVRRWI
jgi:protein-S-isoprenylcysteine O-methyltransferase Ste14